MSDLRMWSGVASVVERDSNRVVGTAFLIDHEHALTCAHVAQAATRNEDGTGPLQLRFVGRTNNDVATVTAQGWFPIANDQTGDLAVLRLQTLADDLQPLSLSNASIAIGTDFRTIGFAEGENLVRYASGVMSGAAGPYGKWRQLETEPVAGQPILPGFSGAPVWSAHARAVVGMVVARTAANGALAGFMVPISELAGLWPELLSRVPSLLEGPDFDTHWGPRARGVEPTSAREGWYFSGRTALLTKLITWLEGRSDEYVRVITGPPGSGKSSVLALLAMLTEIRTQARVPASVIGDADRPRTRQVVPLHLHGLTLDDATTRLASAFDISAEGHEKLILRLAQTRTDALVVADGLDEAAATDSEAIARHLLRPIAALGPRTGIKVLVGTKSGAGQRTARTLSALGFGAVRFDLEQREYLDKPALTRYVQSRLLQAQSPSQPTPYRANAELASVVAAAVGRRANQNFLVAQLVTRGLIDSSTPVDVTKPGWDDFPDKVADAMEDLLAGFGAKRDLVESFLKVLAFAAGPGFQSELWLRATDLGFGRQWTTDDLAEVINEAGTLLVESGAPAPSFKLYHQALVDHLRRGSTAPALNTAILDALLELVPRDAAGELRWLDADPYARAHASIHAAASSRLTELAKDPVFLLAAEPERLLPLLRKMDETGGPSVAGVYQRSVNRIANLPAPDAGAYLMLFAQEEGLLKEVRIEATRLSQALPFTTNWAAWRITDRHTVITDHRYHVVCVASVPLPLDTLIASGDAGGRLRRTSLSTLRRIAPERRAHRGGVFAIQALPDDVYPRARFVTAGGDGNIALWDESSSEPVFVIRNRHSERISALAIVGRQIVSAGIDRRLAITDLSVSPATTESISLPSPLTSVVPVGSRQLGRVVAGSDYGDIFLVDLETRTILDEAEAHTQRIYRLAAFEDNDLVVAVSRDGSYSVWEVRDEYLVAKGDPNHTYPRRPIFDVATIADRGLALAAGDNHLLLTSFVRGVSDGSLLGHVGRVTATAGVPKAATVISGGQDGKVLSWEWTERLPRSTAKRNDLPPSFGLALAQRDVPSVLSASEDGTLRRWSLRDGQGLGEVPTGTSKRLNKCVVATIGSEEYVISGGDDGFLRAARTSGRNDAPWDPIQLGGVSKWITALNVFSVSDVPVILAGREDGSVFWVDLESGYVVGRVQTPREFQIRDIAVLQSRGEIAIFAAASHYRLFAWNAEQEIVSVPTAADAPLTAVTGYSEADSPEPLVVAGGRDGFLYRWFADSGGVTRRNHRSNDAHRQRVNVVLAIAIEGRARLISGGEDGTIRTWTSDLEQVQVVRLASPVTGLVVDHAGNVIAATHSGLVSLSLNG